MLYEIRNYHFDPNNWDAWKQWARAEAIPYLKANLDIVGFWFDNGETPEFGGQDPEPRKYGAANVTWIIRWESMEQRNQARKDRKASEAWQKIWSTQPDPNGYLHTEVRFAEDA